MSDFVFFQQAQGDPVAEAQLRQSALIAWTLAQAWTVTNATYTGTNSNGSITQIFSSANIVWPNGVTGQYALLVGNSYGSADSFNVTYQQESGIVRTITQLAPTRDSQGRVVTQPALVYT